jgi:hypothetical protein
VSAENSLVYSQCLQKTVLFTVSVCRKQSRVQSVSAENSLVYSQCLQKPVLFTVSVCRKQSRVQSVSAENSLVYSQCLQKTVSCTVSVCRKQSCLQSVSAENSIVYSQCLQKNRSRYLKKAEFTAVQFWMCMYKDTEGTRWRSWLRLCTTSRKVAGLIPNGVTGIYQCFHPSGRIVALGSTQPLTEMSTRNPSWG